MTVLGNGLRPGAVDQGTLGPPVYFLLGVTRATTFGETNPGWSRIQFMDFFYGGVVMDDRLLYNDNNG